MKKSPPSVLSRYRILARLGHGGMSDVYLAVVSGPEGFHKLIVVKVLRPELSREPRYVQMFRNEARLSARLNHPNVVQTYEVGESDGYHFLAMEYLEGHALGRIRERFEREGGLELGYALRIVRDALDGLSYAHDLCDYDGRRLEIVHRDATPQNIFVTYQGVVKVVDFGIAQVASMSEPRSSTVSGKNGYMAPEQARSEPLDARADVFTMGVVLWELVTGERLWPGLVDLSFIANLSAGSIPPISARRDGVPSRLTKLCAAALSPRAADRPQTAREFQQELDQILTSLPAPPSERQLGELMSTVFASERRHARATIDRQLQRMREEAEDGAEPLHPPPESSSLPRLGDGSTVHDAVTTLDTPKAVSQAATQGGLRTGSAAALERPVEPSAAPRSSAPGLPSWAMIAAIVGAGMAAGGVNAAVQGWSSSRQTPPPAPASPALAPRLPRPPREEPVEGNLAMGPKPRVELSGDVTEDFTLSADHDYLLQHVTRVMPGATLTIAPGTTIQGDIASKGVLVVLPGGRIEASATADEPIVFTSSAPPGQRRAGDWGGVILLGRAPTNSGGARLSIEGLARGGSYGGTDPNDSSGTLRYVRIEYSGQEIAPNNEINGLSLGAVGRGTTLDHIMVRNTADDCFEFFGGTADAKYLVCQNPGDDAFDWDFGYTGRLQFIVAQSSPSSRVGSNGLEGDNDPGGTRSRPQSRPEIWNATLCGKNRKFAGEHNGLLLRRGTSAVIANAIFSGFATGLDVRDHGTAPDVRSSIFFGNTMGNFARTEVQSNLDPELRDDDDFFNEITFLRAPGLKNSDLDPELSNCFHPTSPDFSPRQSAREGLAPPHDGFFDTRARFRGAFAGPDDRWLRGNWATFGP